MDSYISSLKIKLDIYKENVSQIPRVSQLIQKTKQFNIPEDIKIALAQMEAKVEELDKANPPFREFNTDYIDTLFYDLPVQTASTPEPLNPSTGGKLTKKTRKKNKKE